MPVRAAGRAAAMLRGGNPQILEVCWDAAAGREWLAGGGGEHGAVGESLDQKLPLAAGLLVPSVLRVPALWRQI